MHFRSFRQPLAILAVKKFLLLGAANTRPTLSRYASPAFENETESRRQVPVRTAGRPHRVVDATRQGGFPKPCSGQRDAAPPQQGSPAAQERQLKAVTI